MATNEKKDRKSPRFEIRTPAKLFNGVRAGVSFSGGVGYTDDVDAAAECCTLGYTVTDTHATAKKKADE